MFGESGEGVDLGTPFLLSALEFDRGMPHSRCDVVKPRKSVTLPVEKVVASRRETDLLSAEEHGMTVRFGTCAGQTRIQDPEPVEGGNGDE